MDDLAFTFGKLHERYDKELSKILDYLKIKSDSSIVGPNFSTGIIDQVFKRLTELATEAIANAGTNVHP